MKICCAAAGVQITPAAKTAAISRAIRPIAIPSCPLFVKSTFAKIDKVLRSFGENTQS